MLGARNHKETLKPSGLSSKQGLVSRYSWYFNNLFILHQTSEGKTKKSESIVRGWTHLCAAFCVFLNVQQYPISHKILNLV